MRTQMFASRRVLLPLVLGLVSLIACDTASVPEPNPGRLGATSANAAKSGNGGMVPTRDSASFHAAPGAAPITCAPTIGNATHTIKADEYAGSGPGSHVGMSAVGMTFAFCRTLDFPSGGEFAVWAAEGPFNIEAANGDELKGYFYMTQYLSGNFKLDSVNVTGGTGRFANASGQLMGKGFIDRSTLLGWYTMSGFITRPNF